MRKKRRLLLFLILLSLLIVFGVVYADRLDYSKIQPTSMLNYAETYNYGEQGLLVGDLSQSGLTGSQSNRPTYLSRWEATFTEIIKTGESFSLEKLDNYNIEETMPTDNFGDNVGYALLPYDETTIKTFLSSYVNATQKQQDEIWNEIQSYKGNFNDYGYYELDFKPYYYIPQLVAMAGGKWDHNTGESKDLSDMSQIKGTSFYYLSPPPDINSASINGNQLQVDFDAYGYSERDEDVTVTVSGDKGSKTYTYYRCSEGKTDQSPCVSATETTFHQVFTKDISDFIASTGSNNLQVTINDGFWRTAQANVQRPLNLAVSDIQYSPSSIRPNDKIQVSVLVTNQSSTDITTDLVESVNGNGGGTQTITIPAGSSIRLNGAPVTAPFDSSVNIGFDVNKSHTQPSNETDWSDNHTDLDIPIDNSENLYIHFRDLPESVQWNDNIPVKIVVGNTSDHPITTTVTLQEDYKFSYSQCVATDENDHCIQWKWFTDPKVGMDTQTITVLAKDEYVYTVNMPAGWDYFDQGENQYVVTLTGNVNPFHTQPNDEISYLDNTVTDEVHVNPVGVPKVKVRLDE